MTITRMHLYFDNELSTIEAHEVQVHLDVCEGCLDQFDVEHALRQLVQRCCYEPAPQSLVERLRQMHCPCQDPQA